MLPMAIQRILAVVHIVFGAALLAMSTLLAIVSRGQSASMLPDFLAALAVGYLAIHGGRWLWRGERRGFTLAVAANALWLSLLFYARQYQQMPYTKPFPVAIVMLLVTVVCWIVARNAQGEPLVDPEEE